MADKRKLLLEVDVDVDSKPLRQLGDEAEHAEDGFDDLNKGLKKLDAQFEETTKRVTDLRTEISKSGDLALVKDLQKAERDLKKIGRDRKSIIGDLGAAGADAAGEFSVSFAQRVGPLLAKAPVGPAGAIIGGTIAAAALPYIGATVSAAVLGVAGGAGILGGLVAAKNNSRVQGAAKGLGDQIADQLKKATGPEFINETIRSLDILKAKARDAQPDLERLISSSSQLLGPLSEGAGTGAAELLDGLADAAEGAGPVFRELGAGLASTGDALGEFFHMVSDDGASAGIAVRDTFSLINISIRGTGEIINGLTESYGFLRASTALLQGDTATFTRYVTDEVASQAEAKAATDAHAQAQSALDAQLRTVNVDLAGQIGYLNTIRGANLSAAEANVAYRDALNQARDAADNKRAVTLDEEKALLSATSAANRNVEALERAGATSDEASAAFNRQRDALIRTAEKMGMSRAEAQKYIDKLLAVPKNVNTKISMEGVPTALGQLSELRAAINRLPSEKRTKYIIETNRVTIRTDKGGKQALASGGPMTAGKTYLVGEEGPELVTPTQNGYVHDAKTTAAMARSAGPGSAKVGASTSAVYHVTVQAGYIASPAQLQREIAKTVNDLIRKGRVDANA